MGGKVTSTSKVPWARPAHLMCGQPVWGIAALAACSYLSYLSYLHVRRQGFNWKHDAWSMATYAVWILLLSGLTGATRCLRERLFFALVLANFAMGFLLTVWGDAPREAVRDVRIISLGLWGLAALVSLGVAFSSGQGAAGKRVT